MLLSHRIRLQPSPKQADYFARACGTARKVWNWALTEWNRRCESGQSPNIYALKRQFNIIKYSDPDWLDEAGKPWIKAIHRDCHSQPFLNLKQAWSNYFQALQKGNTAHKPRAKKKGRCKDSFYVANDKFRMVGDSVVLPKVGKVTTAEPLRLQGRVVGATVLRVASHWYLTVKVDLADTHWLRPRIGNAVTGVDLGARNMATLSSGEKIPGPHALEAAQRRLRIHNRRLQRRCLNTPHRDVAVPSKNRIKQQNAIACLHARIANVRNDFIHKLTTRICRNNQTVVIEDLCVHGMLANHFVARMLSDVAFGAIRHQLTYKSARYGCNLIVADRWYPSSRLCSNCGYKYGELPPAEHFWTCPQCGKFHDRDVNAAINLQRLATATALPEASQTATAGTESPVLGDLGGKVTPVRYEQGH